MERLILTDVDETVLCCSDAIQPFCERATGRKFGGRLRDHYHIDTAFGVSYGESRDLISAFWHSDHIGNLKPELCAKVVIPYLHSVGWRFVAVTACSDDPDVVAKRTANLANAFGFAWEAVHCTAFHGKEGVLARYGPAVWVEDHFSNAVAGAGLGHLTFVLDRTYNAGLEHPKVRLVNDWFDIEKALKTS